MSNAKKKGFDRFQTAILDASVAHLIPRLEENKEKISQSLWSHLFDQNGPRGIKIAIDANQEFFGKAFSGFIEITKSLQTLEDIQFYVNRFPFRGTRITRERYLQFHVEAYYEELYILRERLKAYITLIERQYKKDPRIANVKAVCESSTKVVVDTLDGVIGVRARHVHETRFTDDGIDRLSTLALLTNDRDDEVATLLKEHYKNECLKVKKIWKERIKLNNKAAKDLLNIIFEGLYLIVFDQDNSLRIPHGVRTK